MAAWLRTWQQFVCCPRCLGFIKQLLLSHRVGAGESLVFSHVFPQQICWPRSWEPWLLGGCFPEGSCSGWQGQTLDLSWVLWDEVWRSPQIHEHFVLEDWRLMKIRRSAREIRLSWLLLFVARLRGNFFTCASHCSDIPVGARRTKHCLPNDAYLVVCPGIWQLLGHLLSTVHCFPGEPRVLSKRPILGFDHLVGNCFGDECTGGLPDAVLQDKDCRRLLKAWLCAASPVCWSIFLPFFYSIPSVPCRKHSTANPEEILTLI